MPSACRRMTKPVNSFFSRASVSESSPPRSREARPPVQTARRTNKSASDLPAGADEGMKTSLRRLLLAVLLLIAFLLPLPEAGAEEAIRSFDV